MGVDLIGGSKASFPPLSVLIVGCGNIAGGFDQDRSNDDLPYTHAGAYVRDGRFELAACVEPDEDRLSQFMSAWGIPMGYRSIDELLLASAQRFDVVSICSSTSSHGHDLDVAISLRPKLIFCEKPITNSLDAADVLVSRCNEFNIPLAVNHTRRWDPDIKQLREDIKSGRWGELRSAVAFYNKGILNNGSHMVDLLHLLVGPMEIIKVGRPIYDYFPADPTVPVWLEASGHLPVQLICAHAQDYAFFELQLIFSGGILAMEEGGMYWRKRSVVDSETFKGYRKVEEGVRCSGAYPHAMLGAADNIYRAVTHGDLLESTGDSALAAHKLCERIRRQAVDVAN